MVQLHTAGDLDVLAAELAEVLARPLADPMAPEMVAVPSAGMRTWLALRLARHLGASAGRTDGVSANVEMPFPGLLRRRILEAGGAGADGTGVDHWSADRLAWPILAVAERAAEGGAPAGASGSLPAALVEPRPGSSRYAAARRVADLFDRYHLHRPHMVTAWARGEDVDGVGDQLTEHQRWQPRLWREVRAELASPSPPERLEEILAHLRAGEVEPDLPERICVFGMSVLPGGPGFVDLAAALGERRDVHLFVLDPVPAMAGHVEAALADPPGGSEQTPGGRRVRAALDPVGSLRHPLLRSWGRLHLENAAVLHDAKAAGLLVPGPAPPVTTADRSTLLRRLQSDLRGDVEPAADLVVDPQDDSVRFHACHGPARQVEVLRDVLVGLLHDSPLQEDDIVVVCPDLASFAPLIEATFGPSAPTGAPLLAAGDTPTLRYRLADRSLATSAPLVGAFCALLDLVTGRFDSPSVLDFCALEPVRHRFGLGDDELAAVAAWVVDLEVRWGITAEDRAHDGVPEEITAGTWRAALDRLLLGAAVRTTADPVTLGATLAGVVPAEVEGSPVALAGRLAELVWNTAELSSEVAKARPIAEWVDLLGDASRRFFSLPREQAWQLDRLLASLGEVVELAAASADDGTAEPSAVPLTFAEARHLVNERLDAAGGRPSFFRGGITVTSLAPLRNIAHEAVVMLGMDAHALGAPPPDGDDLLAQAPLVGDSDRRGELRQSLLETVLAARRHLVVIRDGHDVRTNQEVPAAVAVAELRDAVLGAVVPAQRDAARELVEIVHPRQPFDEAYLTDGAAGAGAGRPARTFDTAAVAAAGARRRRDRVAPAFLDAPLEAPDDDDEVGLAEVFTFLRNPVAHFLNGRLGVRLPREAQRPVGLLRAELDGLELWALGDDLLARLDHLDDPDDPAGIAAAVEVWRERAMRTGAAPPGRSGDHKLAKIADEVLVLHARARELGVRGAGNAPSEPVDLRLDDGTHLTGNVAVRCSPSPGDDRGGPAYSQFNRRRASHEQTVGVELAALALSAAETDWRAVVATRTEAPLQASKSAKATPKSPVVLTEHELVGDPGEAAQLLLTTVVDLVRRNRREPLPLLRRVTPALHLAPGRRPDWPGRPGYADAAELLVYGSLSAAELCEIPVAAGDPPGPFDDRARRYASILCGTFERTVASRTCEP